MKKFDYSPSEKKNRRNLLTGGMLTSCIMMVCCVLCLTGASWAWFTANTSVTSEMLYAAVYEVDYTVTQLDADGKETTNTLTSDASGNFTLDPSNDYRVTMKASGTASTGFAKITLDGNKYQSVQLAPGEEITLTIGGWSKLGTSFSWGTGTASVEEQQKDGDEIINTITVNYYAYGTKATTIPASGEKVLFATKTETVSQIFTDVPSDSEIPQYNGYVFTGWKDSDGNSVDVTKDTFTSDVSLIAQYKKVSSVVKLVPVDSESAVMIERNGVVETWNTGLNAADIRDVTSIIEPDEDTYNYETEDYATYYVYGFDYGITKDSIADYVKVTGDGTFTVTANRNDGYGTGAVIKVYDEDSNLVEQFYVVIFGDLDGNAVVDGNDIPILNKETKAASWSSGDGLRTYALKAADLDGNSVIDGNDYPIMNKATKNNGSSIDQRTGKSIK